MKYAKKSMKRFSVARSRGYTLIELVIAVGLFALIMTLASGAYLIMISASRQAQSIATGINTLSFALESMTRGIRTGTNYNCGGVGDCASGASSFSFQNESGIAVSYALVGGTIQATKEGIPSNLTDSSVTISSLTFYTSGTRTVQQGDYQQPRVTMVVSGTVSAGPGKTESFTVETGATLRGTDL